MGVSRLPPVHHASGRLSPLRRRQRRSLGRRQTHINQSLHALPSPLGAATVMERDGGGLSYLLGQGFRRVRTCRHRGLEHRTPCQIDAIGVDEIQYSKGHRYLTLVYQIDLGVESFQGFFTTIGEEITSKIVFITANTSPELAQRALAMGATGYLIKSHLEELLPALEAVMVGNTYVSRVLRMDERSQAATE